MVAALEDKHKALSDRVLALERYASRTGGTLAHATKQKFLLLLNRTSWLSDQAALQGRSLHALAGALHNLKRHVKTLREKMTQKQNRLVVELASKVLNHKDLNTTVRVNFEKNFTRVPEVYAAISGFSMDPDKAKLRSGGETSKIVASSLNPMIYTVKTNFYSAHVESISDINRTGFSIRVNDGRDLNYSELTWVQVEWIAIGE
ncbi:hypothetical protein ElyMa_005801400 [Elysia marginata]|uniref:H-type lectin domain-containing protein n=1 Tax=Elysia marginata TaxID=1093978 RepID=A0AAV4FUE3_9GAST|nr:hypothetical protein ElyMa_005801400 [Elysia marginata]